MKPNSFWTKLRRHIADFIAPAPIDGEAWCIDCSLENGRTAIMHVDMIRTHVATHAANNPEERVRLIGSKI